MGRAQIIVSALGLVLTAASLLVMFPLWKPTTPGWWVVKALPTTLSPLMLIIGLLVFSYGIRHSSNLLIFVGAWLALFFAVHILIITLPPSNTTGFLQAFDKQKIDRVSGGKEPYRLKTRLGFGAPKVPAPVFNQDIVFYTLPATGRKLLCDVWEPQQDIKGSGLAVVYLHGSAWCVWDKDAGTRKFFRHLTAQGHVVMDVAYRLYPETNIQGMVHDVKHAVSWIKENADTYGIDPSRVVLCGGSAGGHLSLLSAYTGSHPLFTPSDLIGKDIHEDRTVELQARITTPSPKLLPGMFVNAIIELGASATPAIPQEAVIQSGGKNYIFVLEENQKQSSPTNTSENTKEGEEEKHISFRRVEVGVGVTENGFTALILPENFNMQSKVVIKGAYDLVSKMNNTEEEE